MALGSQLPAQNLPLIFDAGLSFHNFTPQFCFVKLGFVHCFGDVVSEFAEHRFRGYVPELLLKNISFKNCLLQDIRDDTKTR